MVIDTPCIGICSSVYGDPICRGCKRTALEVIDWNRYTSAEKIIVYQRLQTQIAAVLEEYVFILDERILHEKIIQLNIRLHAQATVVEQAFHLLRLGANKIKNLESYGLQVKSEFANLSLVELFNKMDAEVYERASTSL